MHPQSVKKALICVVGSDRVFNRLNVHGLTLRLADMLPEVFPRESHPLIYSGNFPEGDRACYMDAIEHPAVARVLERSPDVFQFFRQESFLDFLRGTGDTQRGAYALRTYIYTQTSVTEGVAFTPDYARIPLVEGVIDRIHQGAIVQHYDAFAAKLKCEAGDFLQDAKPLGLPIPPIAALVLDKCDHQKDLPRALIQVRADLSPLRESLVRFETRLQQASSIKERNTARRQMESAFASFSSKFESTLLLRFKHLPEFAGDVADAVFNWTNPTAYKSSLLTKPLEAVIDWWRRRPLVQLFDVAEHFRGIRKYNQLVNKVFGIQFQIDEIESFEKAAATLRRMFSDGANHTDKR
jgi:hypothetical protein